MSKIINLTPHDLDIYDDTKRFVVLIPKSGTIARVNTSTLSHPPIIDTDRIAAPIPLSTTTYGEVTGLPPYEASTFLIVSLLVKQASRRPDLVSPGELLRNDKGQPIGCIGLSY